MTMTAAEVEATAWRLADACTTAAALDDTPATVAELFAGELVDTPPEHRAGLLRLGFAAAVFTHARLLRMLRASGVDVDRLRQAAAHERESELRPDREGEGGPGADAT